MARSAKLISIDAVREMAVALTTFGDEAIAALDDLDINVRRAVEWIEHDRKEHWAGEVRRGWQRVGEARAELEKALTYRRVAGQTPSCRHERAMLERAKRYVQTAEEINHSLPRWTHLVEHASRELAGSKNLLADWLHGELPKALGTLKQMSAALESYAASGQPVRRPTSTPRTSTEKETPDDLPSDARRQEEEDDENMGPAHVRRETSPGDEGSAGG